MDKKWIIIAVDLYFILMNHSIHKLYCHSNKMFSTSTLELLKCVLNTLLMYLVGTHVWNLS